MSSLYTCFGFTFAENKTNYDISMYVGDSLNLKNYILGRDITFKFSDRTVVQNMNASVLKVSSNSILTPKEIGKGTLILSSGGDQVFLNVTIKTPIQSVTLNKKSFLLLNGEIQALSFKIDTASGYNKPTDLKIADKPHVATVNNDNVMESKAVGTTTLTGKTADGSVTLKVNVTVVGHSYDVKITSENKTRKLNVGETLQVKATLGTKDVTKNIIWTTTTPHILKIDQNGLVTAIGEGRGVILAKTTDTNNKRSYELMTTSVIDKVTLNTPSHKFNTVGETYQLQFNLYPKNKNNPPILNGFKYVSSNTDVATVTSTGLVKAKGPGIALISIIFDDSQKKVSCTVEVPNNFEPPVDNYVPVDKVILNTDTKPLVIGQRYLLSYEILPTYASKKEVTFNVSTGTKDQIRMINGNYYFIPNTIGNAVIEIKAANGKVDKVIIPITSPIESLTLSLSSYHLSGTNEETVYIGERPEIKTKILTINNYKKSDIYPSTLKYSVKNEDIAQVINKDGRYYVQPLKEGKTEILVKSIDKQTKTLFG